MAVSTSSSSVSSCSTSGRLTARDVVILSPSHSLQRATIRLRWEAMVLLAATRVGSEARSVRAPIGVRRGET